MGYMSSRDLASSLLQESRCALFDLLNLSDQPQPDVLPLCKEKCDLGMVDAACHQAVSMERSCYQTAITSPIASKTSMLQ